MIPGHPYPIKYDGYASKVCQACMDTGRGTVVMKPYWTRGVDEEFASLIYVCLRCGHNETVVKTVPLNDDVKARITAPAVSTSTR